MGPGSLVQPYWQKKFTLEPVYEVNSFAPQNLSSIPEGSKQNTTALSADQTCSQGQESGGEKELGRQTRVCGNSLLCGPLPRSGPKPRAATTSVAGQHPAVAQSGPGARETAHPEEIISGRNEDLGKVPVLV